MFEVEKGKEGKQTEDAGEWERDGGKSLWCWEEGDGKGRKISKKIK